MKMLLLKMSSLAADGTLYASGKAGDRFVRNSGALAIVGDAANGCT